MMAFAPLRQTRSKETAAHRSAPASARDVAAGAEDVPSPGAGFRAAFTAPGIEPKVLVNDPVDASERQADEIAARAAGATSRAGAAAYSRSLALPLPPSHIGDGGTVEPGVATAILGARGAGRALPAPVRAPMERALGADLGAVRVHTDARADALNRSLNARAFTTGNDVFFRRAAYDPHTWTGRELLAHELTHAIQQNRGGGSGSAVVQRRLMINDTRKARSDVLREPASTSGVLEPAQNTGVLDPANNATRLPPNEGRTLEALRDTVKRALQAALGSGGILARADDPERISNVLKNNHLDAWIEEILTGAVDHGTIDLAHPQGLLGIYFLLRRWHEEPYLFDEDREESEKLDTGRRAAKARLDDYKQRVQSAVRAQSGLPDLPVRVYTLAVLGRGASVAFYFDTNRGQYDRNDTVVIGKEQPWREMRGGKGNVNQPGNLVEPQSLQDEDPYSGGLSERRTLSDKIDKIISEAVPREGLFDEIVQSVTKKTIAQPAATYYQINTDRRSFYAQNVIAGLGIGLHKAPADVAEWKRQNQAKENWFQGVPRIMDMDRFQRLVADDNDPKLAPATVDNIIVVGPNAVIDVMTTALRKNYNHIVWVTKTREDPTFLPGTDNTHVKNRYDTVMRHPVPNLPQKHKQYRHENVTVIQHDYLGSEVDNDGVTVRYGSRKDDRTNPPRAEETIGSVRGTIMVYGLGPDLEPIKDIFGASLDDVAPIYDKNKRFNVDPAAITPLKVEVSLLDIVRYRVVNEAAQILDGVPTMSDIKAIPIERGDASDPLKRIAHEPLPNRLPAVIGLKAKSLPADETSLTFIGGAAFRLLDDKKLNYTYVSENIDELLTSGIDQLRMRLHVAEPVLAHDATFGDAVSALLSALDTYLRAARALADRIETGDPRSEGWAALQIASKELTVPLSLVQSRARQVDSELRLSASKSMLGDVVARAAKVPDDLIELSRSARYAVKSNPRAQSWLASDRMRAVPYSLPKNILLNDQLTPSRSEIEAASGYMPANVAQSVDFVSSDATIIANHIAEKYQYVPPLLADYVTARIVYDRRHLPEAKAPLPQPDPSQPATSGVFDLKKLMTFAGEWIGKLARLDDLFATAARRPR